PSSDCAQSAPRTAHGAEICRWIGRGRFAILLRLMRNRILFLAAILSLHASALDVGFRGVKYYLKINLLNDDKIEMNVCPIGGDDCFRLSSCAYSTPELAGEIAKLKDQAMKEELEMLLNSSYQSRYEAAAYLPTLL